MNEWINESSVTRIAHPPLKIFCITFVNNQLNIQIVIQTTGSASDWQIEEILTKLLQIFLSCCQTYWDISRYTQSKQEI